MSTREASRADHLGILVIVGGLGLLAWRLRLAGLGDPLRSVAIASSLAGVLIAAWLIPAPAGRAHVAPLVSVTGIGLVTLAVAGALGGTRPPVPWASTALPLALLAAVAEEALFRRALYGRLLRYGPTVAVVVTATAFALLHVPAYGWVVLPVDLGAGLLFGWQRHAAGTWAAPALTHAAANLMAMLR